MRTIETKGIVNSDGHLSVQVPKDVAPGEHKLVIVIDEEPLQQRQTAGQPELTVFHVSAWPNNLSLRREDMYDERGR